MTTRQECLSTALVNGLKQDEEKVVNLERQIGFVSRQISNLEPYEQELHRTWYLSDFHCANWRNIRDAIEHLHSIKKSLEWSLWYTNRRIAYRKETMAK